MLNTARIICPNTYDSGSNLLVQGSAFSQNQKQKMPKPAIEFISPGNEELYEFMFYENIKHHQNSIDEVAFHAS